MIKKDSSALYWLYGKHPVDAAFNNPSREIFKLLVTKNKLKSIDCYQSVINQKKIEVEVLGNSEINNAIGIEESVHQGLAIKVKKLNMTYMKQLLKAPREKSTLLFLDQVTDPQNVGSAIRSSLAFGADAVITTKDNAPCENATLVKASAGAFEFLPYIQVTNLARTLDELKKHGYWVIAITPDGESTIDKLRKFEKVAFLFGAEGRGIRNINLKQSDIQVRIDISSKIQSLNISNAVAISLYQTSLIMKM
jgi:23S rRNA (guanosine2251-2'-O)-methyltransferase